MSVYRLLYSVLCYLIIPIALFRLFWRSIKLPKIRQHWKNRLGFIKLEHSPRIWLHAVSVGETIAAKPLIESLLLQYPSHKLLVTNTTATGYAVTIKSFGDRVEHCYFPYDLNGAVFRFLKNVNPTLLIIMETEIWPNLLHHCKRSNIPVIVANARLSERSTKKYLKILPLIKETLNCVNIIACRSNKDSDHFRQLGATPSHVEVVGNIKFDVSDQTSSTSTLLLKNQFIETRKFLVAASTHSGEDELILSCFTKLKEHHHDLVLVLVPRHPERFDQVFSLCNDSGYIVQRRSTATVFTNECEIILGDSMGEMDYWYSSADIVFLGGSLVKTGGHNPLEASLFGVPVVSGPAIFNFDDVYEILCEANVAWVEDSIEDVTSRIKALLERPEAEIAETRFNTKEAIQNNKGATARLVELSSVFLETN
jgi:3-deoxy-D-manno-octulosonic-acid transferase